jgi:hypothetical protein
LVLAALMLIILDSDRQQIGFITLYETSRSALVQGMENALAD